MALCRFYFHMASFDFTYPYHTKNRPSSQLFRGAILINSVLFIFEQETSSDNL